MVVMQRILMLGLLCGSSLAMAQSTSGSTIAEYDEQSNSPIVTCSIDPDYTTQSYYRAGIDCQIDYTSATPPTSSNGALADSSGTAADEIAEYALPAVSSMSAAGESYTAWGLYAVAEIYVIIVNDQPEFEDPYGYSIFSADGPVYYPSDSNVWDAPDTPEVVAVVSILGWLPSPSIRIGLHSATYAATPTGTSCQFTLNCPSGTTAVCGTSSYSSPTPCQGTWLNLLFVSVTTGKAGALRCYGISPNVWSTTQGTCN